MSREPVGFIGLGNMGSALAANIVAAGHRVMAYDVAGPERTPDGAVAAASVDEIAAIAATVVLSLPDGKAAIDVATAVREPGVDFTRIFPFIDSK